MEKNRTSVWSLSKPAKPKVFGLGLWSASMPDTYKHTEKNSGFCNFQGQCNLNFCTGQFLCRNCAVAVLSEKVWYIESCPETQPLGIASFPASVGSPRHYSIRGNYWQGCIFRVRVFSAYFKSFSF
jgi:hypothetical protein